MFKRNHSLKTHLVPNLGVVGWAIATCLTLGFAANRCIAQSPKNVLFVIFDDLNLDIGVYGNSQVKTPNLDAFASTAVRFNQAHCIGPSCAPSRASFISGLYPLTTGVYDGECLYEIEATKNLVSLFAHFNAQNYDVYGAGKLFHVNWELAVVDKQFDEYFKTPIDLAPKAKFRGESVRHPGNPRIRDKDSSNGSWGPLSDVPSAANYGPGWEGWIPYR